MLFVMLPAVTGVVVQFTISDSPGHSLIGGGVLGEVVLTALTLRKRTGQAALITAHRRAPDNSDVNDELPSPTI